MKKQLVLTLAGLTAVGTMAGTEVATAIHHAALTHNSTKKKSSAKIKEFNLMSDRELQAIGVTKTINKNGHNTHTRYSITDKSKYLDFVKSQATNEGSFVEIPNSQNITMGNIIAEVGNIQVTPMTGQSSITGPEAYTPTAETDLGAGIITPGTVINYSVPISVKTMNGKAEPISKVWITGNPTSTAMNNSKDAKDITETNTNVQDPDFNASTSFSPLSGVSTGNMALTGSLTFGTGDWKQILNPNLEIHFIVNGKEYTRKLNVPTYKVATNYAQDFTFNFTANNTTTGTKPQDTTYQILGGMSTNGGSYSTGTQYNSADLNGFKPTSYVIKLNNADTTNFTYTPCKGVVYNPSNDTYTVTPSELSTDGALFNVSVKYYNPNGMQANPTISVVSMNVPNNYDGVKNLDYTNTYTQTYNSNIALTVGGSGNFHIEPNMQVDAVPGKLDDTNSLTITPGGPFNGTVYDATILRGGLVAVSSNGQLADDIQPNLLYGYTSNSTPTNSDIPNIVENTKFYTGSQIEAMVKAGDKLPLFNIILNKGTYDTKTGYNTSYDFQPLSSKNDGQAIQYDYIKFDKPLDSSSQGYQLLKGGLSQYDSLIGDANSVTGLVIGGGAGSQGSYTNTAYSQDSLNNTIARFGDSNSISGISIEPTSYTQTNSFTISNGSQTYSSSDGTDIADFNWANQMNTYNLTFNLLSNKSQPVFDMSHAFDLGSIPSISGSPVKFKIDGTKIILMPTPGQITELNEGVPISFTASYKGINSSTTVNPTLTSPSYNINQKYNGNDLTNNSTYENQVGLVQSNDQIQVNINQETFANDNIALNNDGNKISGTMTATTNNMNNDSRTYSVIAGVPNQNTSMTPGSFNNASPLTASSMSINGGSVGSIYVLPKSALNAKNEAILQSKEPNAIPGEMSWIENPASGWIKVSSLTDTKDVAGVAYNVTVKPHSSSRLTMNLTGPNNKKVLSSYYGSQYKYYSNTTGSGALSNISNTAVVNPKLTQGYIPANTDSNMPSRLPFSISTFDGSTPVNENNLTTTGDTTYYNSGDANTQTQYSGKFNNGMQTLLNKKELNSLGYKLTGVTINGKNYTAAQFRNMQDNPLFNNFPGTYINVIAHVEKIKPTPKPHYKVTISVVNSNGGVLVPETTIDSDATLGQTINYKKLNNPLINQYLTPNPAVDGIVSGTSINGQSGYVNAQEQQALNNYLKSKGLTAMENSAGPNYQVAMVPNKVTGNMNIVITVGEPADPSLYENNIFLNTKGQIVTPAFINRTNWEQKQFNSGMWANGELSATPYTKLGFSQPASVDPGTDIPVLGNETFPGYHVVKVVSQESTGANELANPNNEQLSSNDYNTNLPNIATMNSATGSMDEGIHITSDQTYSKMPNASLVETWYWAPDDVQENLNQEIVTSSGKVIEAPTSIYKAASDSPIVITEPQLPKNYHLVKMELNGKTITSLPNNMPSNGGTIKYIIAPNPKFTVSTEIVTASGKVLQAPKVIDNGYEGSNVSSYTPIIPKGYKLEKVVGKVPNKIGDSDVLVKYVVVPIPKSSITVSAVVGNKVISTPITTTQDVGSKYVEKEPTFPSKYKLSYITVNGVKESADKLPSLYGNKNDNIVYHLVPATGEVKVETVYPNGKVVANSSEDLKGNIDSLVSGYKAVVPAGYKVTKVLVNNKEVTKVDGLDYTNTVQTIKYVLSPLPKNEITQTINLVNDDGKMIQTLAPTRTIADGYQGEKEDIKVAPNPNSSKYTLQSVVIDGVKYSAKDYESHLPSSIGKTKESVVYNYVMNQGSITTEIQGPNGISDKTVQNGNVTTPYKEVNEKIPAGYKITSVTVDGKAVKDLAKLTIENTKQTVVYHIAKIPTNKIVETVNILSNQGKVVSTPVSSKEVASGYEGENTTIVPYSYNKSEYHIASVTINGKKYTASNYLNNLPKEIGTTEGHIVYNLVPNTSSVSVSTVYPNGKIVSNSNEELHGNVDSKVSGYSPVVPNGYKIAETLVNGKIVKNIDIDYTDKGQTIKYKLAPIPENIVSETVNVLNPKTGKISKVLVNGEKIADNYEGSKIDVKPYSYNKDKYSLSSVVVNGKTYTASDYENNLPKDITDKAQTVVYNLVPRTGNVVVSMEYPNGTIVTGSKSETTGDYGNTSKVNEPNVPAGYKVSEILVNGKPVKSISDINYNDGTQTVVYKLTKLPTYNVTTSVIEKLPNGKTKLLYNLPSTTAYKGEEIPVKSMSYNHDKYTLTETTENTIPTKTGNKIDIQGNTKIVYTLTPNVDNANAITLYPNGNAVKDSSQTAKGEYGSSITTLHPVVPAGYHLVSETVNNKEVKEGSKLTFNENATSVVYRIAKIPDSTIVQTINIINSKGTVVKVLSPTKVIAKDYIGDKENIKTPTYNKEDYSIKSVEINGVTYSSTDYKAHLPKDITKDAQNIIYNLIPNKGNIKIDTVVDGTNKVLWNSQVSGDAGNSAKVPTEVPAGYKIDGVTINGKKASLSDISKMDFNNGTQNVKVIVSKIPDKSITQEVLVHEGNKIITLEPTTVIDHNYEGKPEVVKSYNYNKNLYTLTSVVINGKTYSANDYKNHLPKGITDVNQSIVYNLTLNKGKVNYETVYPNGTIVKGSTGSSTNYIGSDATGIKDEVPAGYRVSKITLNNNDIKDVNGIKITDNKQTVVYHLTKIPNNTISESANLVGENGKKIKTLVPVKTIDNSYEGNNIDVNPMVNPNKDLYHLSSVVINGVKYGASDYVNHLPKEIDNSAQTIVYNYTMNKGNITTEIQGPNGTSEKVTQNGDVTTPYKSVNEKIPAGYKISSVTVNGVKTSIANLPKLTIGNKEQIVVYHITKLPNNIIDQTVNIVNAKGEVTKTISSEQVASGYEGESVNVKQPSNPNKDLYHLSSVVINGVVHTATDYKKFIPNDITDSKQSVVYNYTPNEGKIVTNVEVNGKYIEPVTQTGNVSSSYKITDEKIPAGYQVSSVTVNGNAYPVKDLKDLKIGNQETIVTYHLTKIPDNTISQGINLVNSKGQKIKVLETPSVTNKGYDGEATTVKELENPNANLYHIVSVNIDGKTYPTGHKLPSLITDKAQTIIYNYAHNKGEITIKQDIDGKVTTIKVENGDAGQLANVSNVTPKGYKLTNITVNGKIVNSKDIKYITGNKNVVYHYSKLPNNKIVSTVNLIENGKIVKVLTPEHTVASGYQGQDVKVATVNEPNNIHLDSVVINGVTYSPSTYSAHMPKEIGTKEQSIIWNYSPNKGDIKTEVEEGSKVISSSVQKGDVDSPYNVTKPNVPAGYEISSITVNNVPVKDLSNVKIENNEQTVVYHLTKIPSNTISETVNIINKDGKVTKVLVDNKQVSKGYEGEEVSVKPNTNPNSSKYHLVSVIVDGHKYSATDYKLPNKITDKAQTIVYNYAPNQGKILTNIEIDGKFIDPVTQEGNVDNPYTIVNEKVPVGYHITSVTVDGKTYPAKDLSKLVIGNKEQVVTYHVSKLPSNTISKEVNIVDANGKVISTIEPMTVTNKGYEGEVVKPDTNKNPNKDLYHLSSVVINGIKYNATDYINNLPKDITDKSQTVIYNYTPNEGSIKIVQDLGGVDKTVKVVKGNAGETVDSNISTPAGYKLTGVTENGKAINPQDVKIITGNSTLTYHYTKLPNNTISTEINLVNAKGKTIEVLSPEKVALTGYEGEKATVAEPKVENKDIHLVSVIINGVTYSPSTYAKHMPTNITDKAQSIVWNYQEYTGTITTKTYLGNKVVSSVEQESNVTTPYNHKGLIVPKGYKVISTTVNGVEHKGLYTPNIKVERDAQTVVYHLGKIPVYTVSQKVVLDNGKVLVSNKVIATGEDNAKANIAPMANPNPDLYHLTGVEINGKDYTPANYKNNLPKAEINKDQQIIYKYAPNVGKIITSIQEGNKVTQIGDQSSVVNTPYSSVKVTVPAGYKISSITVDGKTVDSLKGLDVINSEQKVVYHLAPLPSNTISVTDNLVNGDSIVKVLSPSTVVAKGYDGENATTPKATDYNKYHLVSVIINGVKYSATDYIDHLPKEIDGKAQTVVYNYSDNNGIINTEGVLGNKVIQSQTQDNKIGTNYDGKLKTPVGYRISSITLNGKEVTQGDLSKLTIHDGTQTVIYHYSKLPTNTISQEVNIVNSKGKVTKVINPDKVVAKGYDGESVNINQPQAPKNCHLVSVDINGVNYGTENYKDHLPKSIDSSNQNIVYNYTPNQGKITTEVSIGGHIVKKSINVETGDVNTPYKVVEESIPSGYQISSITVDGKTIHKSDLSKVDFNNSTQTIIYNVDKIPTNTISVGIKTTTGQIITEPESTTGEVGQKVNVKVPTIPVGYKKVDIQTANGTIVNNIPDTANGKVYWIIVKAPVKVNVTMTAGNKTISNKNYSGIPGTADNIISSVPKGYHIVSITENGKPINKIPTTFGNQDSNIKIIIAKDSTNTITKEIIGLDGKIIGTPEIQSGNDGDKITIGIPTFNHNEYHISKIIVNGAVDGKVPTIIGDKNVTVKYVIAKNNVSDTIKVVYQNGSDAEPTRTIIGNPGASANTAIGTIPSGYHLVKTTVNGTDIDSNNVPNTFGNTDSTIVYTIAKNVVKSGTVKVEIENSNGNVEQTVTTTGEVGSKYTTLIPNAKVAYITVNGSKVNTIPENIISGDTTIIYHLAPSNITPIHKTGDVKIIVENQNGKVISTANHIGEVGSTFTPISISKNDTINSITVNGKSAENAPTKILDGDTTIIYHVTTPSTSITNTGKVIIKIINQNGKVVGESTQNGKIGSEINKLVIPKGDIVNNITVNGTIVNNTPNKIVQGSTTIIYHVTTPDSNNNKPSTNNKPDSNNNKPSTNNKPDGNNNKPSTSNKPNDNNNNKPNGNNNSSTGNKPVTKNKLEIKVVTSNGEVISSSVQIVPDGTSIPVYKVPNGYHLVGESVNGNEVNSIPTTVNSNTNIVYTITKNEVNTPNNGIVNIKYVDNGNTISSSTYSGKVGSKISPINVPKGYKITKILINGVVSNSIPDEISSGKTNIVVNISKIDSTSNNTNKLSNVTVKVVTTNGKVLYLSNGEVKVGSEISVPSIPNGYHLVKTTASINGEEVNSIPKNAESGNIIIIYTIAKNAEPSTSGNNKPETGGNTKPSTSGNNKPETGGNTKPSTSGSNKSETGGNTKPSTSGSNKPETGGNTKPSTSGNNKPETGGNTKSSTSGTNKTENTGNTKSENKGSNIVPGAIGGVNNAIPVTTTQGVKPINSLPDTGLPTNTSNNKDGAEAAVGILGILGLAFLFKKKK